MRCCRGSENPFPVVAAFQLFIRVSATNEALVAEPSELKQDKSTHIQFDLLRLARTAYAAYSLCELR